MVWVKPKHQSTNRLNFKRNLQPLSEYKVGHKFASLMVLNFYCINQDAIMKYYEVIYFDPYHDNIQNDDRINCVINIIHKHCECCALDYVEIKSQGLIFFVDRGNSNKVLIYRSWWFSSNHPKLKRY